MARLTLKDRVRHLWRHHRIGLLVFAVVIAMTGVFGVRTASQVIYWSDPSKQDQPLAGWMTPRYVARSYDVPPDVMIEALFDGRRPPKERMSIEGIAAAQGVDLATLQTRVDVAVTEFRARRPRQ